jgi:hypothetical protein
MGRNQDAVTFLIDINDGTIETLVLSNAGRRGQADEEETGENGEKSRTDIRHIKHSCLSKQSGDYYRIRANAKQTRNSRVEFVWLVWSVRSIWFIGLFDSTKETRQTK